MEIFKMYLCPSCRSWLIKEKYCVKCHGYWILDPMYKDNPINYKEVSYNWEKVIMDVYNIKEIED